MKKKSPNDCSTIFLRIGHGGCRLLYYFCSWRHLISWEVNLFVSNLTLPLYNQPKQISKYRLKQSFSNILQLNFEEYESNNNVSITLLVILGIPDAIIKIIRC